MTRCKECMEEIHTTFDGLEIDHAPECPINPLHTSLSLIYDQKTKSHYFLHPDDPLHPYHPITLGAAIDIEKQVQRYEQDWQKENHPTVR